jgi:hypothetical protein
VAVGTVVSRIALIMSVALATAVGPALGVRPHSLLAQEAPPRDTRPSPQTGTAVIRGRVLAADSQRPLRRARITVTAPELLEPRIVGTDADGRYEVGDLPPGRYRVEVRRSG